MPRIQLTTVINAPSERCFDEMTHGAFARFTQPYTLKLMMSDRLAARSPGEYPASRACRPAIAGGSCISPTPHLVAVAGGTTMHDDFDYTAPLGPLGKLADWLFLERCMRRLLLTRNRELKRVAEQLTEQEAQELK